MTSLEQTLARLRRIVDDLNAAGDGAIHLTVDGGAAGPQIARMMVGLNATIDELPDVLRDVVPEVRREFARSFAGETSREGGWRPLARSTIAERNRLGYGPRPILRRTGALRRHVLTAPPAIVRQGDTVILRIAPGRWVPGTGASYFLLGAGGTGGRGARIPSRPMVELRPDGAARLTGAITRAVRQRAVGNGLG